jgi:methionine-rich copper-binding protein CopC
MRLFTSPTADRKAVTGRPSRSTRIVLTLGIGVLAGMLLCPATALGHAELDTATPADKATVEGTPSEIVMTFTEPVDPAKSSIKLVDAGGTVIAEGSTVDASDAKTMRLALTASLAPATYTVRWTTASALDGDLDHGTTTFTVAAAASEEPTASASETAASPSTAAATSEPSVAPSTAPSVPPTAPAASASDAVIPVVIALLVLVGLGLWLMLGRSRGTR